jgi:hypothetical protein
MSSVPLFSRRAGLWLAVFLLAGCAGAPTQTGPSAADLRAEIARRIPAHVPDRNGWAVDIQSALAVQRIDPMPENLCAILAVTEQETGYDPDPVVPGLAAIARRELERRAGALHVPKFVLDKALGLQSADGRTYAERLAAVRTERELSTIYEDMAGRVPLGRQLLADWNPVQTGGPMQVSIPFAEAHARDYPYPLAGGSVRDEVFTRRGGMYFGIAHLLGYTTPYTRKVHRFADYNAGWYASRNAAFQNAVAIAGGRSLALDGDLLLPGSLLRRAGETEQAVRALAPQLGMDDARIREELQLGDRLAFGDTALFHRVFELAEAKAGRPLPREMIPGITLESPKITRELTTAWFATRVDARYRDCMTR